MRAFDPGNLAEALPAMEHLAKWIEVALHTPPGLPPQDPPKPPELIFGLIVAETGVDRPQVQYIGNIVGDQVVELLDMAKARFAAGLGGVHDEPGHRVS